MTKKSTYIGRLILCSALQGSSLYSPYYIQLEETILFCFMKPAWEGCPFAQNFPRQCKIFDLPEKAILLPKTNRDFLQTKHFTFVWYPKMYIECMLFSVYRLIIKNSGNQCLNLTQKVVRWGKINASLF